MNLLEKLRLKSKTSDKRPIIKHKKALLTIATSVGLALTIAFSAFAGVGCKKTPTTVDPTNPNNPTITDPNNPDPTKPDPSTPTDSYCDIIKDISNSNYYKGLIDKIEYYTYSTKEYAPHPYGFLVSKGHDIESIKNGGVECQTIPYIIGDDTNTLYVDTRVENKRGDLNYYTFYSLEYNISDKEYQDLYDFIDKRKIEASLFVQELSYQRTPTILYQSNIEKSTYESWQKLFDTVPAYKEYFIDVFDGRFVTFDLVDFNVENNTLKCKFSSYSNNNNIINNNSYRITNLIPHNTRVEKVSVVAGTNILNHPNRIDFESQATWEEYKNNPVTITSFDLQGKTLDPTKNLYENELTK